MFMRPTPPMPRVSKPMKPSNDLDSGRDDAQVEKVGEDVEDEDGALVFRVVVVMKGERTT